VTDGDAQVPSGSHGNVQAVIGQLRTMADRLSALTGLADALPSLPAFPGLPPTPGALSAAQLKAVAEMVRAQRSGIAAMQSQLSAFDRQLEVLELILDPLVEWSSTWAVLEKRLTDLRPGGQGSG
jgi:outer membrane protein TolC